MVVFLLSVIIISAFGFFLERFCFRYATGNLDRMIIITIAIILVLENSINVTVGAYVRSLPSFAPGVLKFLSFSFAADKLLTFVIGGVLLTVVIWFTKRTTKDGRAFANVDFQDYYGVFTVYVGAKHFERDRRQIYRWLDAYGLADKRKRNRPPSE